MVNIVYSRRNVIRGTCSWEYRVRRLEKKWIMHGSWIKNVKIAATAKSGENYFCRTTSFTPPSTIITGIAVLLIIIKINIKSTFNTITSIININWKGHLIHRREFSPLYCETHYKASDYWTRNKSLFFRAQTLWLDMNTYLFAKSSLMEKMLIRPTCRVMWRAPTIIIKIIRSRFVQHIIID